MTELELIDKIKLIDGKTPDINSVIDVYIIEPSINEFAHKCVSELPKYFFTVAASSSGKYHPECDLGEGGLVRHTVNVMLILNHIMELEQYGLTEHEKDLLRVAALFHDGLKSGTQEMWESSEHTKHLHPFYSATFMMENALHFGFDYNDAKFISDAIMSHMGQWTTSKYSEGTLPKPETKYQQLLHLADFLASRKDINVIY